MNPIKDFIHKHGLTSGEALIAKQLLAAGKTEEETLYELSHLGSELAEYALGAAELKSIAGVRKTAKFLKDNVKGEEARIAAETSELNANRRQRAIERSLPHLFRSKE